MKNIWTGFSSWYVALSFRKPALLLFLYTIVSVLFAAIAISEIRIVTNLAALLPEGTPSVKALDESKTRVGSTDFFTIAIESKSKDIHAIAEMQDRLKDHIDKEWSDAAWVQIDRDTSFFKKHALYYLPEEKLTELREILDEELLQASSAIPGMVLLDEPKKKGEGEPSKLEQWYDVDLPRRLGLPPQVENEFNSFFQNSKNQNEPKPSADTTSDVALPKKPPELRSRLIGPANDVGVLLVQLEKPSTDLDYAKSALERGEALIASVEQSSAPSDVSAQVVGAYRSFMEVRAVANDGATATSISLVLVLVLMIVFFRSGRTVIAVVTPLVVAASLTMGVTALTYGRLTVLTIFVLAMLIGMGIDYGIHLFGRTIIEFRAGSRIKDATQSSVFETGKALLAAAATTIASLLTLLFGHFEGFKEFGVIASYGLALSVISAILVIPPVVAILERIKPILRKEKQLDGALSKKKSQTLFGTPIQRFTFAAFALGIAVTIALVGFIPKTQFEYDFRNLRAPKTDNRIGYGRAIGKRSGTAPAVILGESKEQMKEVHDFLLKKQNENPDPRISSFITLFTFVPTEAEQIARKKIIDEIGVIVYKRAMKRLKGEKKRLVKEIRTMVDSRPFDENDIPEWAQRIITERDGTVGHIGHMYTKVKSWNAYEVRSLQDDYGYMSFAGKWLPIANSNFILSDVVKMVQEDGKRLLGMVTIALVLILALFARSIKGTALLLMVIGATAVWTAGMMGMFDIRLGLYNLIVIPVVLGVGIDGAIHMYHRHLELGFDGLAENIKTTGLTITASSWTTMAGFAGLLFVSHQGLRTIGILATIGVGLSWLALLVLLPQLLSKFVKR